MNDASGSIPPSIIVGSLSNRRIGARLSWKNGPFHLISSGTHGDYHVFRISSSWIVLYFHMITDPIPYLRRCSTLNNALKEAQNIEDQLLFAQVRKKAEEDMALSEEPGKVKSKDDPTANWKGCIDDSGQVRPRIDRK
jgi:hypothetical protein